MNEKPTIIIKRITHAAHGHHGGAWKIAYADFVTAMMAFFLLMWLLNMTSAEQKAGLSNYFDPRSLITSQGGSNGIMGGLAASIETEAATIMDPTEKTPVTTKTDKEKPDSETDEKDKQDTPVQMTLGGDGETEASEKMEPFDGALSEIKPNTQEQLDIHREEKMLESMQQELAEKISQNPEIQAFSDNILMDITPEGLRIQIIDDAPNSMFASGSTQLLPNARTLLTQVGHVLTLVPNQLKVSGHTDGMPYANPRNYDNYDLSSDRANASRRVLIESGIPRERMHSVIGLAASEPHIVEDPKSPRNRRISILVMRQNPINPNNQTVVQGTNIGASQTSLRAQAQKN